MSVHNVHDAKTNLSRLIAAALAGEEIIIARGKVPAVKLVPVQVSKVRAPGALKGKIAIDDRFFEPLPDDELALWNGEGR